MCKKTTKAETVVHPAGQDWANAPVVFPGPYGAEPILIESAPIREVNREWIDSQNRLSAPPRASLGDKVGLVLGALWNRLCGHSRWLSCAILIAAVVVAGIGVAMEQLSHLIP